MLSVAVPLSRRACAVWCADRRGDIARSHDLDAVPGRGRDQALDAPVLLHPADDMLWQMTHPDKTFRVLEDGATLHAGGIDLRALHTPGHSPGSVCWYAPDLEAVFSGDTLFQGGPGATGRSYSSHDIILRSIHDRLLPLDDETIVHTGHGDDTTIGAEADAIIAELDGA